MRYTKDMKMQAAGAYFRALREYQQLTQSRLAELVGVTGNTIWRIEAGAQEPRGELATALLTVLRGRIEDLQALISDVNATADDGRARARGLLSQADRDSVLLSASTDVRRAALLRRIARLTEDPELRARIEGYLDAFEGVNPSQPREE